MPVKPLYRDSPRSRVVRQVREWIVDGTFPVGSELPPERDLAERLDMPRPTVNRAIAELMEEGLIVQAQGRTRLIAAAPVAGTVGRTVLLLAPPLGDDSRPRGLGGLESVILGAQAAIRAHGWHCLTLEARSLGANDLMQFAGSGHLGLVLGPINIGARIDAADLAPALARFHAAGVPVVSFGDEAPGTLDRVVPDHRAGARALVTALHAAGHRRIWQVVPRGVAGVPWWDERRAGYEEGMRAVGLPLLPMLDVPGHDDTLSFDDQARSLVGHLLPAIGPTVGLVSAPASAPESGEPADALLALNDHHAIVLARACRLLGRRLVIAGYDAVGEDLPGRDEEPGIPDFTVDPCWWECGHRLIQVLAQRKRSGAETAPIRELILPQVLGGLT